MLAWARERGALRQRERGERDGQGTPGPVYLGPPVFPVAGQARVLLSRAVDRTAIPARRAPVWLPGWEFIGKLFLHTFQFMHPIYASSFLANW